MDRKEERKQEEEERKLNPEDFFDPRVDLLPGTQYLTSTRKKGSSCKVLSRRTRKGPARSGCRY